MQTEKVTTAPSGYLAFVLVLVLIAAAAYTFYIEEPIIGAVICVINFVFILPGLAIVNPNESKVLTLFGKYQGTVKKDGFFWVNPFTVKKKVSLKAFNLNGQQLKVNDSVGNPIEIAAVIVWQIKDTAKAVFAVENYLQIYKARRLCATWPIPSLMTILRMRMPVLPYVAGPSKWACCWYRN